MADADPKFLTVAQAVHQIGSGEKPVSATAVLRAARRLDLVYADRNGRAMLAVGDVAIMARNYKALGYLHARGAQSLQPLSEAS